jgi:hypothetical protein
MIELYLHVSLCLHDMMLNYVVSTRKLYLYLYIICVPLTCCYLLCGLVVRVLGYRSGSQGSIPGTTRKKVSGSGTGSTQPCEYN